MCTPGTAASRSSYKCKSIYDIPTPTWADGFINSTAVPTDVCVLLNNGTLNTTTCDNCSAGQYQGAFGGSTCLTCGTDSYSSYNGSTSCEACPTDSHIYQPSSGPQTPQVSKQQCLSKCPPGTYSGVNYESIPACMPCVPGSYSEVGDAVMCFPCAVGNYTQQFAAQQCTACPTATSTLSIGANNSNQCVGAAEKNLLMCQTIPHIAFAEVLSDRDLVVYNESHTDIQSDPLIRLQQRVLGFADIRDQALTVTLDQGTISDKRLSWFMEQATGLTQLVLKNSTCLSRLAPAGNEGPFSGQSVVRTLQCTGWGSVWGYSQLTAMGPLAQVTLLVSQVQISGAPDPILHLALLLIDYAPVGVWRPFRYSGLPLFDGIPIDAWVHNIGFGWSDRRMGAVVVQASTSNFDFRGCDQCKYLSDAAQATLGIGEGRFMFKQGIALYVDNAYIRLRVDGTYRLLGLERLIPQVIESFSPACKTSYVHSPCCVTNE